MSSSSSSSSSEEDDRKKKNITIAVAAEDDDQVTGNDTETTKKPLFQRVFSEEDELALLKGIFDYSKKNQVEPAADMNAFNKFIKSYLHIDVNNKQLAGKIRRLKKRYNNNLGKSLSKGSHELEMFSLSEKIWGEKKITGKKRKRGGEEVSISVFYKKFAMLSLEEKIAKFGLLMPSLEKDWTRVRNTEFEAFFQRNEAMTKTAKLMLEKLKLELNGA